MLPQLVFVKIDCVRLLVRLTLHDVADYLVEKACRLQAHEWLGGIVLSWLNRKA